MKKFAIFSLMFVSTCAVSQASPCVAGSLFSYAALGSAGCQVGSVTFSDFSYLVGTVAVATNISSTDILVSPTLGINGPQLDFAAGWSTTPSVASVYTAILGFRVTSPTANLTSSSLNVQANRTGLGGVASVTEVNCLGGLLGGGNLCLGNGITGNALAITSLANTQLAASILPFGNPVAMIDVIKNINLVGAVGSVASISHITENFGATQTPEPSTFVLLSSAAIAAGCFRRFRRQ